MSFAGRRDVSLSLAALGFIAALFCFWNLEYPSIHTKDEHLHISATQDIYLNGDWFTPRIEGVPYLNKPPFKMWLTQIPLMLFGESNTAYRSPDALAGVLLVVLTAFLASRLFASAAAGWIAGLSLLSANTLLFHHGFRVANKDALLLMLLSLSFVCGFRVLDPQSPAPSHEKRANALACGLLVGLGVLTKSVGGLLAILVLGAFYLLSRHPKEYFRISPALVGAFLLPAFAIPAAYFVPQFLLTEGAFETMFVYEVKDRALTGYHNREDTLFFFKELFVTRGGIPPALLVAGLLWGAWEYSRSKRSALLMLLIAAILPFTLYSIIPSRLPWYIFPMYPASAVLAGGACAAALQALHSGAFPRTVQAGTAALISAAVIGSGGYQLARQLVINARQVRNPGELNEINRLVNAIKEEQWDKPDFHLVVFGRFSWRRDEQPYATQVRHLSDRKMSVNGLKKIFAKHSDVVVVVPGRDLPAVLELDRKPAGYLKLPESSERHYDLWILSYIPGFGKDLIVPGMPVPSG